MRSARLLAALAGAALATGAHAQTAEWINPDGGDWLDGANWASGSAPAFDGIVRFDLDAAYTVLGSDFYRGRRFVIDRSRITLATRGSQTINFARWTEGEAANPPAMLIGDTTGATASLTTDIAMYANRVVVGAGGSGSLLMSEGLVANDIVLGGTQERADAFGEAVFAGPDAYLQHDIGVGPGEITIGLAGTGRLALLDGAVGENVDEVRLAVAPGSRGVLELRGAGTRLETKALVFGEGSSEITIADGAALLMPEGSRFRSFMHPVTLTIDGGAVPMFETMRVDSPSSEVTARGGSRVAVDLIATLPSLEVEGAGTSFETQALAVTGALTVRDGAAVIVEPVDFFNFQTATVRDGVEIDGGTLVVDWVPLTNGFARTSLGTVSSVSPELRFCVKNGGVVAMEGFVQILFRQPAEIRGDGTIVRHFTQGYTTGSPPVERLIGQITLVGLVEGQQHPRPRLDIADSALVNCSSLILGATVHVDHATVIGREILIVEESASLALGPGAEVRSPRIVIARRYTQEDPWNPPTPTPVSGSGMLDGAVSNSGIIDPGTAAARGVIQVAGAFNQSPHRVDLPESFSPTGGGSRLAGNGILHIDIASPADHDRLEVTGEALLGGTLEVALVGGFAPAWGDAFTVLTAGAIDGGFETLDLPAAPAGFVYEVEYTDAAATLSLARRTDITRDLVVGAEDLGALLQQWGTDDERADVNGDGVVDGADLGIVLGDWGAQAK